MTALNIIEIGKTPDPQRREKLRAFEKRLAKSYEPLDVPNELVKKLTAAFFAGEKSVTWSITDDRRSLWVAMSEPNSVGDGEREELEAWAKELEQSNRRAGENFRPHIERIFLANPNARPRTPGQLLRVYIRAPWWLHYWLPAQVSKEVSGRVLPLSQLNNLLEATPSVWPVYLAAYALLIYSGSVWLPEDGPRNAAGLLDAWSAAYLPFCDVFVTRDTGRKKHGHRRTSGQYQLLRVANLLNRRKPRTRVVTWEQFRRELTK